MLATMRPHPSTRRIPIAPNADQSWEAGTVRLGAHVRFRAGEIEEEYTIVADCEADAMRRRMSADCPVGQAMLGRRAGEQVRVRTPSGSWTVTVLEVR
jgi:transcription elongation factor GreA